ncbi:MAG: tetratricopeptide repeat protein [Sphingobacteriales bacterium]|nr:MAG: tetratricopeptide repeat protein [Sphingobacteriales bacterium]
MKHRSGLSLQLFRKGSGIRVLGILLIGLFTFWGCGPSANGEFVPTNPDANRYADTAAIQELIAQGRKVFTQDSSLSDSLLKAALLRSQRAGYAQGAFLALRNLAYSARSTGDYKRMLARALESLPYAKASGNTPKVYSNIGMAYLNLGKHGQALHYYTHALDPENGPRTYDDSALIYINTGFLWDALEEHTQALDYYLKASEIARIHQDSGRLGMTLFYAADGYYYTGDPDKSVVTYKQALEMVRKTGKQDIEYATLYSIAMAYIKLKKYDSARFYLLQTQDPKLQEKAYADHKLATVEMWGAYYLATGQPQAAARILPPALAEARAGNLPSIIYEVEPKLAQAYFELGRFKEAYQHQQAYLLMNDSILKQEKVQLLNELTNVRLAAQEQSMMAQQLQNVQEKQVLQRNNFWLGGTIALLLLLIGVILLALRAYRNRQAYQQGVILQLRQSQEINQLKAQIRGEEQERERVARELHDGIASQLWAITLSTSHLQQHSNPNTSWKAELSEIYQQLRDASQNVRRTAHNLMPDLLLQEGLSVALASVCKRAGHHSALEIDFLEYGQIPRVDPEIELSIFRMVQELIQNTLKHAIGATYLLVQVSCTDALLNITVEDNGPGFEPGTREGVGLHQIRKRVAALKGHFDLESTLGKGTAAYLEFDLSQLI